MINPTTDAITEFATPTANASPAGSRRVPTATSGSPRLRYTGEDRSDQPDDRRHHRVPRPLRRLYDPAAITTGPDGNLWFTDTGDRLRSASRPLPTSRTGGDAAAAGQRHRGQLLRPDGRGRGQLGQPHHLLQRHGDGGAGEQPRRRHPRRHADRDGVRWRGHVLRTDADQGRLRLHAQSPAAASAGRTPTPSP